MSQADLAVLVISARKGEFETGFERGGQVIGFSTFTSTMYFGMPTESVGTLVKMFDDAFISTFVLIYYHNL